MTVQRWTSASVTPSDAGGFVSYGDYLRVVAELEARLAEQAKAHGEAMNRAFDDFQRVLKDLAGVVAAEREACAKAFEAEVETWEEMRKAGFLWAIKRKGAAAIRARSEKGNV
jgi:hypothetical protein